MFTGAQFATAPIERSQLTKTHLQPLNVVNLVDFAEFDHDPRAAHAPSPKPPGMDLDAFAAKIEHLQQMLVDANEEMKHAQEHVVREQPAMAYATAPTYAAAPMVQDVVRHVPRTYAAMAYAMAPTYAAAPMVQDAVRHVPRTEPQVVERVEEVSHTKQDYCTVSLDTSDYKKKELENPIEGLEAAEAIRLKKFAGYVQVRARAAARDNASADTKERALIGIKQLGKRLHSTELIELADRAAADPLGEIWGVIEEKIAKLLQEAALAA
jgi:hypothetical protein